MSAVSNHLGNYHVTLFKLHGVLELAGMVQEQAWGPGGSGPLQMPPSLSPFQLSDELKQHLTQTLSENYGQPGASEITTSVDRLQQDVSPSPWA